jgi:hypothetical protein
MSQKQSSEANPRPLADTEENYRMYLAFLLSETKSRGNTRYYNKFAAKCKNEAVMYFPIGSAQAAKKDRAAGGWLAALFGFS